MTEVIVFRGVPLSGTGLCVSPGIGHVVVPVSAFRHATVQAVQVPDSTGTSSWSTAQLTVKRSNTREGPFVALASATTVTEAAPMTAAIDLAGFAYLALEVTTAQASKVVDIYIALSDNPA